MALSLQKEPINLVLNIRTLIDDIKSMEVSTLFTGSIDEVRDHAPGYYSIIENPMDLSLISKKLINRHYNWPIEVLEDFRVICRNCRRYYTNPMFVIREKCDEFEAIVLQKWQENAQVLLSQGIEIQTEVFDYSQVNHITLHSDELFQEQQEQVQLQPTQNFQSSLSDYDIAAHSYTPFTTSSRNFNNFQTISHPSTDLPQHRPYFHINPLSKGNSLKINLSELIRKGEGNTDIERQEFKANKMNDLFGSFKNHESKKRKFDFIRNEKVDLAMEFQEKVELKKVKMQSEMTSAENKMISITLGQQNKNMQCEDL